MPPQGSLGTATSDTTGLNVNSGSIDGFDNDGTMAANSASHIPSQAAVVTYVAAQIAAAMAHLLGTLPTADPHSAGKLWNNAGVLTVSAG